MEDKNFFYVILKKIFERNLKSNNCLYRDCQESPISSHVLQKAGILKPLSENNRIIQSMNAKNYSQIFLKNAKRNLAEKREFKNFRDSNQDIPIESATTFSGFCKKHDNDLFDRIEGSRKKISVDEYIFLYSYRAFCYSYYLTKSFAKIGIPEDIKETLNKPEQKYNIEAAEQIIELASLPYQEEIKKFQRLKPIYEKYIYSNGEIDPNFLDDFCIEKVSTKKLFFAEIGTTLTQRKDNPQESELETTGIIPSNIGNASLLFSVLPNSSRKEKKAIVGITLHKLYNEQDAIKIHNSPLFNGPDIKVYTPSFYRENKQKLEFRENAVELRI